MWMMGTAKRGDKIFSQIPPALSPRLLESVHNINVQELKFFLFIFRSPTKIEILFVFFKKQTNKKQQQQTPTKTKSRKICILQKVCSLQNKGTVWIIPGTSNPNYRCEMQFSYLQCETQTNMPCLLSHPWNLWSQDSLTLNWKNYILEV